MSQNGGDAPKASSPGRPRHQIRRSISEISSPIRLHRHQSHRATTAGRETERESRTPAPQSTIPVVQGRRSCEWPKSEGVTPNLTPSVSRRTSVLYASADEAMPPVIKVSKDSRVADALLFERHRAAARARGLARSLSELETFASSTTRQLDDTYYAFLEKLSTLQGTITALKELAEHARQLNTSFSAEAAEVVADINSQLDAFGNFEEQQQRIEALRSRILAGRGQIRALSERVDAVSEKIEGWQRADKEWQEKTRKRLKVVWIVTSVVIFLVVTLFVGSQYAGEGMEGKTAVTLGALVKDADAASTKADQLRGARDTRPPGNSGLLNDTEYLGVSSPTADLLRVFDEL
ncbi:hypothetical protein VTI74DRAFT_9376 [Chaetomium olivicolor]